MAHRRFTALLRLTYHPRVPYRSARVDGVKLTPDAGIVDDMVRQFADRHAFLRELVQNGIDAGATRIDVRIERSPEGEVRTSVEDDGAGMTRAIIEGPLLTLFESSKEADSTKIGKYGIGFVSVFATEPDRVDVRTRRANEAWIVRLFGDHSFELAEDAPRPGTGTDVTLVHTMTPEVFSAHVALSRTALSRWCRHAHVPITFVALDGYDGAEQVAINVPLALPGLVMVRHTEKDETFVVSIGEVSVADGHPPHREESSTFGAFYNRGLTLMESVEAEPGLEDIRFKIESPRLSHTLSRDSIRRDRECSRVLDRVRDLVRVELWTALSRELVQCAESAPEDGKRIATLLQAAFARRFLKQRGAVAIPLVETIDGKRFLPLGELQARTTVVRCVADESSVITKAMANLGLPVVRHVALGSFLSKSGEHVPVMNAHEAYGLVMAIEERDDDRALVTALSSALRAGRKKIARVRLARFDGVASDALCRVVKTDEPQVLSSHREISERCWGARATLFLNAEHATVRLARRRAKSDVGVAAHLLVRHLLVSEGPLAEQVVDDLLESAALAAERENV